MHYLRISDVIDSAGQGLEFSQNCFKGIEVGSTLNHLYRKNQLISATHYAQLRNKVLSSIILNFFRFHLESPHSSTRKSITIW